MKSIITVLFAAFSLTLAGQNTAGSVDISVTTQPNGKDFSPKHVLAIWIEDASGNFVKTLKLNADRRIIYLYTWNTKSEGNTTDATTGATLSSHGTHSVSWDCTNVSGAVVDDGDYAFRIEYTSEHAQGPMAEINFSKSAGEFSVQPADESYFTNMDLVYTPEAITGVEHLGFDYELEVYPVPASTEVYVAFQLLEKQETTIKIYQSDMKLVRVLESRIMPAGKHVLSWDLRSDDGAEIAEGIYFLTITGHNKYSSRQILVR